VELENQAAAAAASVDHAAHADLLDDLMARIAPCFARRETRLTCRDMVNGLLSELEDYNCWTLAEAAGHASPYRMQHLLSRARVDERQLLDAAADWAAAHITAGQDEDDVVLIVDETADEKSSAGVVILSFRVSRGRDLRRPVVDSVADGTLAALSRLSYPSRSLPDRTPADRWSPSARASWRRSCAFSSASCLLRSRAAVSLARSDASVDRCPAGMAPPAEPAPLAVCRRRRIWLLMSAWV
jgi:hypothetical protein